MPRTRDDQPAVAAEDQQARLGQRGGPDPRPEHQHQRGRGHGQVDEGHVEPGERLHAEPLARSEQLHGQRGDRDQEQGLGGRDPATAGVQPAPGQCPGRPGARRPHHDEQPQAEDEEQGGLGQHQPRAPGTGPGEHQPVQDLVVKAVVVGLGQDQPEDG